jgi:hypothetical protein
MNKIYLMSIILVFTCLFESKAQLCSQCTTSDAYNACIETEIENRLDNFCKEQNINLDSLLFSFNTYLINSGYCSIDSIDAGYHAFLKNLACPIDRTSTVDKRLAKDVIAQVDILRMKSIGPSKLEKIYLDGFHEFIFAEYLDTICHYSQMHDMFSYVNASGITYYFVRDDKVYNTTGVYQKPIYQFLCIAIFSFVSNFNYAINGERVFMDDFLSNSGDIWDNHYLKMNCPTPCSLTVEYMYSESGKFRDVQFFYYCNQERMNMDDNMKAKAEKIFYESFFDIGLFENEKVSYCSYKYLSCNENQ